MPATAPALPEGASVVALQLVATLAAHGAVARRPSVAALGLATRLLPGQSPRGGSLRCRLSASRRHQITPSSL